MAAMKRSTNLAWSELKVGIILVGAFLIGTITIVSFSGIREYFRPTFEIHAQMDKISGLKPGALVMLSGVHVGNVRRIQLSAGTGQGVLVSMRIYSQYQNDIRRDAKAMLGSQGLLGDKYVELDPGSGKVEPVHEGDIIAAGGDPSDIANIVGQAEDVTAQMKLLIAELTGLARELRTGQGTLGRMVQDDNLYQSARQTTDRLGDTADKLGQTADTFGDTARAITEAGETYKKLGDALRKEIIEPDGTLKKLAQDPAPFENLSGSLVKVDAMLEKLAAGEGSLGKLLNDDEVTEELTGLLKDIRRLVNKIENNPKENIKITIF